MKKIEIQWTIPVTGHIPDLSKWFGRRSFERDKIIWHTRRTVKELVPLIKEIQAELDIQLNWRIVK